MSLFASLGQGDIWALSGISFASPINDLLDRGNYSLDDLLNEDELIQEVKAKNERLIEFLSTEKSIDQLLDYVIVPANPDDSDLRKYKYPYMSCEVICCEVPELLHNLVESDDGRLLNKLFTFLDQKENLDCYLAGYFEKILEMLFRKLTSHMMFYFNSCGITLLKSFLNHVQNYSIMQIIQRLMLPHLPFAAPSEGENPADGGNMLIDDNNGGGSSHQDFDHCNWSFLNETCELLLSKMLHADQPDIPLHISDMLITVLQLSPPETLLVKYLCQSDSIKALLISATAEDSDDSDPSLEEQFSLSSNISLAATSVLESLISRLYESGFPLHNPTESDISRTEQEMFVVVNEQLNQICEEIAPHVPRLTTVLIKILENSEKTRMQFPTKIYMPRLGHHGLQLIKLIESLTRVGNPVLDKSFCDNGLFEACLEVFLLFEYNSIMHLSVQRIFVTVFEGPASRAETQAYICSECDLLRMVMSKINSENYHQSQVNNVNDQKNDEDPFLFTERHSSIMGNVILIAHAAFLLLDCSEDDAIDGLKGEERMPGLAPQGNTGSSSSDNQPWDDPKNGSEISSSTNNVNNGVHPARTLSRSLSSLGDRTELDQREKALFVRAKIKEQTLLRDWDDFSQTKLREVLDHQTMGSYEMPPAEIMTASQDDPLKLGVDLDVFGDDDDNDNNHHNQLDNFAHFPITKHQEMHQDPDVNKTVFRNTVGNLSQRMHSEHNHGVEDDDDVNFHDSNDDFADFADFSHIGDDPFATEPTASGNVSSQNRTVDPFADDHIDFGKTTRLDDF